MLMHHLSGGTPERHMSGHHFPERHAKRVEVRSDVHGHPSELLRAGKLWSSGKNSGRRNRGLRKRLVYRLCQPKIDDFRRSSGFLLQADHDVAWFDVSVYEALFVHRGQPGGDLGCDFQRQLYLQPTGTFDELFECFSLYELHRVKAVFTGSTQVEDRGNIWVTDAGRCTGFAQKAESRRFIAEVSLADDLQSHGAAQIDVERFVSDPHRTATQLDRPTVFARNQLVVVKSLVCLYWCRFERIPSRRPSGLNPTAETLTKHANRAEFHRSREFVAAGCAGAFGLRAHSLRRPSAATSTGSNTTRAPSGAKSAGTAQACCCPVARAIASYVTVAR